MYQQLTYLLFALSFHAAIFAQNSNCTSSQARTFLHGNNVRALIPNNGSLFYNYATASSYYKVPFRGNNSPNTIGWAGLMIAGNDAVGNIKAASSYGLPTDFWAGPLDARGLTQASQCQTWDKMWTVMGYEIKAHLADWRDNGRIDNPIPSILGFPARQNPYFLQQNGFNLPDLPNGYAAFFDRNGDNIYNPMDGDYPRVEALAASVIPAQITWCVFNDNGNVHLAAPRATPLQMEVQLTTWALECADTTSFLNRTLFASYRFVPRGVPQIQNVHVGLMTDFDIDCQDTDYLGCDTLNHCFYAYNGLRKGDNPQSCSHDTGQKFGKNPPVQAVTFLNRPLSSFGYSVSGSVCHPVASLLAPNNAASLYNVMQGRWSDGTPYTEGGSGFQTGGRVVKHLFPSSPFDTSRWKISETRPLLPCAKETYALGVTKIGTLPAQQIYHLDMAFSLHRGDSLDAWQNVELLRNTEIPQLREWYQDSFRSACTPIADCSPTDDCVWAGDANRDGIADYQDVLPIAWATGQNGTNRLGDVRWSPKSSAAWRRSFPDGVNLKHVDCDADGKVSVADFDVTQTFYGSKKPDYRPNDRFTEGADVVIESASNLDSLRFSAFAAAPLEVRLVSNLPDLVGLSFEMAFDPRFFHFNSSNLAVSNGQPLTYLTALQPRQPVQTVQFSIGLTDSTARLSPQKLLTWSVFRNRDSFPIWTTNTTFIRFKNMRGLFKDGSYRPLGGTTRRVRFAENPPLSTEALGDDAALRVYPNPAQDVLQIEMGNSNLLKTIELYDVSGRKILVNNNIYASSIGLEISNLPRGFYFLRAHTEGGVFVRKIVLK